MSIYVSFHMNHMNQYQPTYHQILPNIATYTKIWLIQCCELSEKREIWVAPRMETKSTLATVRQTTGYHRVSNLIYLLDNQTSPSSQKDGAKNRSDFSTAFCFPGPKKRLCRNKLAKLRKMRGRQALGLFNLPAHHSLLHRWPQLPLHLQM